MRRLVWPVAGLLVVVVGVVWALVAPAWNDYAWSIVALDADPPVDAAGGVVVMSPAQGLGLVIAAVGLLVLAAWVGFRLGRSRARST